jgi:magnesium transporter
VLHAIADHYLDVTAAVQDDIDTIKTYAFSSHHGRGTDAGRIHRLDHAGQRRPGQRGVRRPR